MKGFLQTALASFLLIFVVQVNGFSRYGRTCKDIGCLSTEHCVMVADCDTQTLKCGYPTCVKTKNDGTGQTTSSNNNHGNRQDSVSTNTNPYANANAPPIDDSGRNYPPSSTGTNSGYPAYPSSSNNNNNGYSGSYPSSSGTYSSTGMKIGSLPYPTQNRMPMPGQSGVYQQAPPPQAGGFYPGNNPLGYPPYPTNQQYPSHSNYPYQTRNYNSNAQYPRFSSSAAETNLARPVHVFLVGLSLAIAMNYLS